MIKSVFITGASGQIGRAAAEAFAQKGYELYLAGNRRYDDLVTFASELEKNCSVKCTCIKLDVKNSLNINEVFKDIFNNGNTIDILVNCAGISKVGLFHDMTDTGWDEIIATNLSSVFYCCRAIAPHMISKKAGRIINISSVFGIYGASCEAAYSATKGAINAFTRSLGKELAPSNIQVNAIAFGAIDTSMNDNLSPEEKNALCEEIPAGRFSSAREAGEFIETVASSPSYLNGQVLQFDGAWI